MNLKGFSEPLKTAVVTAIVTIMLAFGIASLVGDRVEEETKETALVTRYLVCDVIESLRLEVSEESHRICREVLGA